MSFKRHTPGTNCCHSIWISLYATKTPGPSSAAGDIPRFTCRVDVDLDSNTWYIVEAWYGAPLAAWSEPKFPTFGVTLPSDGSQESSVGILHSRDLFAFSDNTIDLGDGNPSDEPGDRNYEASVWRVGHGAKLWTELWKTAENEVSDYKMPNPSGTQSPIRDERTIGVLNAPYNSWGDVRDKGFMTHCVMSSGNGVRFLSPIWVVDPGELTQKVGEGYYPIGDGHDDKRQDWNLQEFRVIGNCIDDEEDTEIPDPLPTGTDGGGYWKGRDLDPTLPRKFDAIPVGLNRSTHNLEPASFLLRRYSSLGTEEEDRHTAVLLVGSCNGNDIIFTDMNYQYKVEDGGQTFQGEACKGYGDTFVFAPQYPDAGWVPIVGDREDYPTGPAIPLDQVNTDYLETAASPLGIDRWVCTDAWGNYVVFKGGMAVQSIARSKNIEQGQPRQGVYEVPIPLGSGYFILFHGRIDNPSFPTFNTYTAHVYDGGGHRIDVTSDETNYKSNITPEMTWDQNNFAVNLAANPIVPLSKDGGEMVDGSFLYLPQYHNGPDDNGGPDVTITAKRSSVFTGPMDDVTIKVSPGLQMPNFLSGASGYIHSWMTIYHGASWDYRKPEDIPGYGTELAPHEIPLPTQEEITGIAPE